MLAQSCQDIQTPGQHSLSVHGAWGSSGMLLQASIIFGSRHPFISVLKHSGSCIEELELVDELVEEEEELLEEDELLDSLELELDDEELDEELELLELEDEDELLEELEELLDEEEEDDDEEDDDEEEDDSPHKQPLIIHVPNLSL